MGKYDNNPVIKGRYKASGCDCYINQGFDGSIISMAVIDNSKTKHGHQMISVKDYLGVKTNVTFYDILKNDYSRIIEQIYKAVDDGNKIIALAYSGDSPRSDLEKVCKYAFDKGVFVVCSAGNSGTSLNKNANLIRYPAGYSTTYSVLSLDNNGLSSKISSHSSTADSTFFGQNMLVRNKDTSEELVNGTSDPCQVVAYMASLLMHEYVLEYGNYPTPQWMIDEMRKKTIDIGGVRGYDKFTGYGFQTLHPKSFYDVMLSMNDTDLDGVSDRAEEIRDTMKQQNLSYEDARVIVNKKWHFIGYDELGCEIYGGRKY